MNLNIEFADRVELVELVCINKIFIQIPVWLAPRHWVCRSMETSVIWNWSQSSVQDRVRVVVHSPFPSLPPSPSNIQ